MSATTSPSSANAPAGKGRRNLHKGQHTRAVLLDAGLGLASRFGLEGITIGALADIVSLKMYEITPQITLTGHILVIHSLYINDKFYQSLPDEDKKWFDEAAKRSANDVWVMVKEGDEKAKETILANKGHINTPSKEFHEYLVEAGKRSWKLFYDTVPNCQA